MLFTEETAAQDRLTVALGRVHRRCGAVGDYLSERHPVVLQGPAVYEVDDRNGGFLHFGNAAVLCKAAWENRAAAGTNGAQTGTYRLPARRSAVLLRAGFSGTSGKGLDATSGTTTFRVQDVDLSLSVNRQGEVVTRMLSPADVSWPGDPGGTRAVLPLPGELLRATERPWSW